MDAYEIQALTAIARVPPITRRCELVAGWLLHMRLRNVIAALDDYRACPSSERRIPAIKLRREVHWLNVRCDRVEDSR